MAGSRFNRPPSNITSPSPLNDMSGDQPPPQPSPSQQTSPAITPLEKLFEFYRQELSKKYEAVMQALQAFNDGLKNMNESDSAVKEFKKKIVDWYTSVETELEELHTKGLGYVGKLNDHQSQLKKIIDDYKTIVSQNPYSTYPLPQPLQDIQSNSQQLSKHTDDLSRHSQQLSKHEQQLAMIQQKLTNELDKLQSGFSSFKQEAVQRLETEMNERIHKYQQARQTLQDKLNKLKNYYGYIQANPRQCAQQKYHDVLSYMYIAIESCPAEVFNSQIVKEIDAIVEIILNCIDKAIKHKRRILGIIPRSEHWLEYHYKHPARAINNLKILAREKFSQFNNQPTDQPPATP